MHVGPGAADLAPTTVGQKARDNVQRSMGG